MARASRAPTRAEFYTTVKTAYIYPVLSIGQGGNPGDR